MKKAKKQVAVGDSKVTCVEDFIELVNRDGEEVFEHEWDSGGPGAGAGCERVVMYKGQFWYCSNDQGTHGPYDDLQQVLAKHGLLMVNEATTEIDSSMMSTEEILEKMECQFEDTENFELIINGEAYIYVRGAGFSEAGESDND